MVIKRTFLSILTHPNSLTLFRVAAVPLIVVLMMFPNRFSCLLAAFFFSAAAITDYFDGYLARRFGLVSNLGKILDPLADKLLVSCSFIMMIPNNWAPAWMVCIIIGRELAVTGLRHLISESGEDPSASKLGKLKTGFQIAAIIPLLMNYRFFGIDFHVIGYVLLWFALVVTIWSGIDYFVRFRRLLTF